MDIALHNIDAVINTPDPVKLIQIFVRIFFKLLDPAQDRILVLKYRVTFLCCVWVQH